MSLCSDLTEKGDNVINKIVDSDMDYIISRNVDFEKLRGATVMISGANGMIASYIIYTLLSLNDKKKYGVTVLAGCRNIEKAKKHFDKIAGRSDFKILEQDVTESVEYDGEIDYMIHAASQAGPRQFVNDPVGTLKVNTIGTINMLELARKKSVRGFLYTSTREIYGYASEHVSTVTETEFGHMDCADPRTCYPEGKRVSETMCASYKSQYGVPCTIVRIAHTYGYGMDLYDGRVIADLTKNIIEGSDIVLKSDGSKSFAVTYIADMVSGILTAFLNGDDLQYNVVNDTCVVSIKDIADALVASRPGIGAKLVFDIPPEGTNTGYSKSDFCRLDASKVKSLGWTPDIGAQEGLKRTVEAILCDQM